MEAQWRLKQRASGDADISWPRSAGKARTHLDSLCIRGAFQGRALNQDSESTPFMAMDGSDLYLVLDQRIRLEDLLKLKKRHANETGGCYLPASAVL